MATPTRKTKSNTSKKKKQPERRPVRREVGGGVCLLLCLCVLVSYFNVQAIVLDWMAKLIRGLFGYGYYLAAPALGLAGVVLLTHRGRPVRLRTVCTLLVPLVTGALGHMFFCRTAYQLSASGLLKGLWSSGTALKSGGAVSGMMAVLSITAFSKIVSIVLLLVVLVLLLLAAFHLSVGAVIEKARSRQRLEYEMEEEPPARPADRERPKRLGRPSIDIPLDEEQEKKPPSFSEFFRHKSDQIKTPDQVLQKDEELPPEPLKKQSVPPPPEPAELGLTEAPAPEAAAPPPKAESKKLTSEEVAAATQEVSQEIASQMAEEKSDYQYPPITLLRQNHEENFTEVGAELRNNSRRLAETLSSFGVVAKAGDVVHGPSVTRYEFVLDQGVKLSKLTGLADDIALALGASGVRIAPIPDKISVVGIEVPNKQVSSVLIRDVIESSEFVVHKSNVAFAVGKDIGGNNIVGNIAKLPHVLIAGTTGSGKSVCTNSLIVSLLYKSTPDEVRFIMVDPKMVELAPYNGIPHLLIPVVTDPKKAAGALQWAVFEMMKRYKLFSEHGIKDLAGYNALARKSEDLKTLPTVVVVIDELADLMLVAAKEVEESICRVAQMGRAAGMHLVIATQRPSADVITGLMKANIPSRIAFAVASSLESRIILDTQGAEKLVGRGDMLYAPLGAGKPQRIQGCFISPEEIEQVVEFVKQSGDADYDQDVIRKIEESMQEREKGGKGSASAPGSAAGGEEEGDELLPAAVDVVLETGQASVSMLQRRLKLGYSRAARLVDQMEERGIVGPFEGSKPRQLLVTKDQWQEMQMRSSGELPERPEAGEEE
ncbi:DNA translocase FtsK [Oscillibacter sp. MSJ-2]|uniref:DNA translocase FtsK n=1 Tax=Dysosmobacter acutus TaxID=2841504 RepID=A0ABS6F8F2_9FIRM|nr:DNA translocase FtsK [Dysosmobacter acutus]MBU5626569.1 DNA translocase FtsK [Dysosmobacter acutus]